MSAAYVLPGAPAERLTLADCPSCKTTKHIRLEATGVYFEEWTVHCGNCYDCDFDGENFHSKAPLASGRTREEAVEAWADEVAE